MTYVYSKITTATKTTSLKNLIVPLSDSIASI